MGIFGWSGLDEPVVLGAGRVALERAGLLDVGEPVVALVVRPAVALNGHDATLPPEAGA